MAYHIKHKDRIYKSLREAMDQTNYSKEAILRMCYQSAHGWEMIGIKRVRPDRVQIEPTASMPTLPVSVDISAIIDELKSLRDTVQGLRSEVLNLNNTALEIITLPPGTQLNLPLTH